MQLGSFSFSYSLYLASCTPAKVTPVMAATSALSLAPYGFSFHPRPRKRSVSCSVISSKTIGTNMIFVSSIILYLEDGFPKYMYTDNFFLHLLYDWFVLFFLTIFVLFGC